MILFTDKILFNIFGKDTFFYLNHENLANP